MTTKITFTPTQIQKLATAYRTTTSTDWKIRTNSVSAVQAFRTVMNAIPGLIRDWNNFHATTKRFGTKTTMRTTKSKRRTAGSSRRSTRKTRRTTKRTTRKTTNRTKRFGTKTTTRRFGTKTTRFGTKKGTFKHFGRRTTKGWSTRRAA
jgi:hypothetical protein